MPLSAADEAQRLLQRANGDALRAGGILEQQLNALHLRAQVLVSLAGVVVTVTGFSGRLIALTGPVAAALLVSGLGLVLAAAAWLVAGVMQIRWITAEAADDASQELTSIIARRNRRTWAYRIGGLVLVLGLILYGAAIAVMLLNPDSAPLLQTSR